MDTSYETIKKELINLFMQTARHRHRYEVFSDFVTMAANAIHNRFMKVEKLEQEYLDIAKKYSSEDMGRFAQLTRLVAMGLAEEGRDILGNVFMELELGSEQQGQFFTPHPICALTAQLQTQNLEEYFREHRFIIMSEPACGSGSMILAVFAELLKQNYLPFYRMWVQAIDVNHVAASMCYIQLSLCGIPGEVIYGNALTTEIRRVLKTPTHYLFDWGQRLSES
ncbi:N-6 DNA methylase [Saezia sanguinis]|uniref:N-6 DNA methylase n=1 Tax=Saezia sanguinis TaxID=1965230 RepID=UPI0030D7D6C6